MNIVDRILTAVGPLFIPIFAVDGTPEAGSTANLRPGILDALTNALHVKVVNSVSLSGAVEQGPGNVANPWVMRGLSSGIGERLATEGSLTNILARLPGGLSNSRFKVESVVRSEPRAPIAGRLAVATTAVALSTATMYTAPGFSTTSVTHWLLTNVGGSTVYIGPHAPPTNPLGTGNSQPVAATGSMVIESSSLSTTYAICDTTMSTSLQLIGWSAG